MDVDGAEIFFTSRYNPRLYYVKKIQLRTSIFSIFT